MGGCKRMISITGIVNSFLSIHEYSKCTTYTVLTQYCTVLSAKNSPYVSATSVHSACFLQPIQTI